MLRLMPSLAVALVILATAVSAWDRRASARRTCIDALAGWPHDRPCPPDWFRVAVNNLERGKPCNMQEITQ